MVKCREITVQRCIMKKKQFLAIGIIIVFLIIGIRLVKKELWEVNAVALIESLHSINGEVTVIQDLSKWTQFEWDTLYSFAPYTPKETIYETIGYKWDTINETVNEGMNQLVFLHRGQVVCYLYGYPENNKIGLTFGSYEGSHVKLTNKDELAFKVTREDEITYLEYIN